MHVEPRDESISVRMPSGLLVQCLQRDVLAAEVNVGDLLDDRFGRYLIADVTLALCSVSGRPLVCLGEWYRDSMVHHLLPPAQRVRVYRPLLEG